MPKNLAEFLAPPTKREKAALAASLPVGRVYGYARVSIAAQADEGKSLDVQQRIIAGYAQMNGLVLEKFVERGVSGSKPLDERPEGSTLLDVLRPGDTVITPKLDRMFHSALDALGILEKMKTAGIALHMIDLGGDTTTNGVSKLVFTILSAVAEAERDAPASASPRSSATSASAAAISAASSPSAGASMKAAPSSPSPSSRTPSAESTRFGPPASPRTASAPR
jgi:hypothetical protein